MTCLHEDFRSVNKYYVCMLSFRYLVDISFIEKMDEPLSIRNPYFRCTTLACVIRGKLYPNYKIYYNEPFSI